MEGRISRIAKDYLAERGFDPVFGARPLKRTIQQELANKLAEELLSGWVQDGDTLRIDATDEGLAFETVPDVEEEPAEPEWSAA